MQQSVSNNKAREAEAKASVLNKLLQLGRINRSTIIADEYPLTGSGVRADLAILQRHQITAIEVKTEVDTLRRLDKQLKEYSNHLDHVILALASKHFLSISPNDFPDVEIWSINGSNKITKISNGKLQRKSKNDPNYLRLLTKTEQAKNAKLNLSARAQLRLAFEDRYRQTSLSFWEEVGDGRVLPTNLRLLSRFKDIREKLAASHLDSAKKISAWADWS